LPKSCKYRQRWEAEWENGHTKISKDNIANWAIAPRNPFCVVVLIFACSKFVGVARHTFNRVEPYTPKEIVAACTGAYSSPPLRDSPSPRFENVCLEI
jgi:hypothetical protein